MNILFSSCGRRVELLRFFRSTLNRKGGGIVLACDMNPLASALQEADRKYLVPPCSDDSFIPKMLGLCQEEAVNILIPLIDTELRAYSSNKKLFKEIGTDVIVSDPAVIEICESKAKTAAFFEEVGLPFLHTVKLDDGYINYEADLPAVLKPDRGSGGIGVYTVASKEEVAILRQQIPEPVLQGMARGQEVTIDCLVDRAGSLIRFVARERLEIRAGESSKGRTFKDEKLAGLLSILCRDLGAFGPITIQCFRDEEQYVFSEINPRFGGGYPLAHIAGADFPRLLISLIEGESITGAIDEYEKNVYMTRFDEAFYLKKNAITGELQSYNCLSW